MLGTHERMVETIKKHIDIYYLCETKDMALQMTDTAKKLYAKYNYIRVDHFKLLQDDYHHRMRFSYLSGNQNIVDNFLCGFQGAALVHPDVYKTYDWKWAGSIQMQIINTNVRNKPWLDN